MLGGAGRQATVLEMQVCVCVWGGGIGFCAIPACHSRYRAP